MTNHREAHMKTVNTVLPFALCQHLPDYLIYSFNNIFSTWNVLCVLVSYRAQTIALGVSNGEFHIGNYYKGNERAERRLATGGANISSGTGGRKDGSCQNPGFGTICWKLESH